MLIPCMRKQRYRAVKQFAQGYTDNKYQIKTMNSKMATNSQLQTTELKNNRNKSKLSEKLEQEQNHRNGDHMEGYQQGEGRGEQGIRSIIDKYKIDRERLRTVQELEKPKNLYVRPMDINQGRGDAGGRGVQGRRG